MRSHIRHGEPPHNCAASVFERLTLTGHLQPEDNLPLDELRYLQEKLYDGYFAFEALTSSGACRGGPIRALPGYFCTLYIT